MIAPLLDLPAALAEAVNAYEASGNVGALMERLHHVREGATPDALVAAAEPWLHMPEVAGPLYERVVDHQPLLQASVRAGDIEAQLLAARNDALSARQQLAMLLGRTDTLPVMLPSALPGDSAVRAFAAATAASGTPTSPALQRDDVRAAELGARAAAADRQRATATLLPRLNGFARYDYNSPTTLYAGKPNWTVGVMGSWSLFGGGSELADVAGASARARGARASEEAAKANARVEADAAVRAVTLATQRLDLANAAAAQSREAYRLVEKRYAGGLATIAELLGAESTATAAALSQAAARYALLDALAQHRRAIGADPGALAALDGIATTTPSSRNEDPTV